MDTDTLLKTYTIKELIAHGYCRVSNKYRTISRIDRADWLSHMARLWNSNPARFMELQFGQPPRIDCGWSDIYRRSHSEDRLTVLVESEFKQFPSSVGSALDWKPFPHEVQYVHYSRGDTVYVRASVQSNCGTHQVPVLVVGHVTDYDPSTPEYASLMFKVNADVKYAVVSTSRLALQDRVFEAKAALLQALNNKPLACWTNGEIDLSATLSEELQGLDNATALGNAVAFNAFIEEIAHKAKPQRACNDRFLTITVKEDDDATD